MYRLQLAVQERRVILGEQGSWAPIHMHQMDFQWLPSGVQVDVRVLSPNAEDNAWRRPYPLGPDARPTWPGHLGPADLHLVLVGGGLSRLWAGWQATQVIVQPRHSHRLAAHAVPRSWARLNQGEARATSSGQVRAGVLSHNSSRTHKV